MLNKNLFEIPVYEIHKTKVLWTVIEGKKVFRTAEWKPKFVKPHQTYKDADSGIAEAEDAKKRLAVLKSVAKLIISSQ